MLLPLNLIKPKFLSLKFKDFYHPASSYLSNLIFYYPTIQIKNILKMSFKSLSDPLPIQVFKI